jgi:hypothetical protein
MMMNNPKPGKSLFPTETSKKFDRAALRWITIPASAAATGFLVYYIADDAFPENTATAFGWLGALAGFWFAYTGRLARLFRKV